MFTCCPSLCSCCKPPGKEWTEYSMGDEGFYYYKGEDVNGSVWGSGPYTGDSHLILAAIHAGVVEKGKSGVQIIKVTKAPGCNEYTGTTANGVSTSSYGSYHSSMTLSKM